MGGQLNKGILQSSEQSGPMGSTAEAAPISVFLVDDVPELRELIRYGIQNDPDFEVVGEAGDGRSAIEGIAETRPAAVLLDLSMPDMNGMEAILEIRARDERVTIIVLSGFSADRMAARVLDQGA